MQVLNRILFFAILISGIGLLMSCETTPEVKGDYVISEQATAQALTIGWHVKPEIIAPLVGNGNKPRIVKGDSLSTIFFYIVTSEEHDLNGEKQGEMKAAHLVMPIEKPAGITGIDAAMACPINIVESSQALGDKLNEYTFATYSGEIKFDLEKGEEKYIIEAAIETVNGSIEVRGMFDKEGGELVEGVNAMLSTKSLTPVYFFGSEKFTRFIDGRGQLKTSGNNLIDAMDLKSQPFYLKYDKDISWSFDFVK